VHFGKEVEKGGTFLGVVAELVTEDAEGAWRIAEALRGLGGRPSLDEVGTEGFILAMERLFRGKEEGGGLGLR
jgi:hypothetical protein